MTAFLAVGLGGALGAMLRHAAGLLLAFPHATWAVNVLGSFLIGLAFVLLPAGGLPSGDFWRPLLMVGLLGGFTTFSSFSLDCLRLVERGQWQAALAYVVASLLLSLVAVALAVLLARRLAPWLGLAAA